jgi:hypothetical protein
MSHRTRRRSVVVQDEVISWDAPGEVPDDVVWARSRREKGLSGVRCAHGDDLAASRTAREDARRRVLDDDACSPSTRRSRSEKKKSIIQGRTVCGLDAESSCAGEVWRWMRLPVRDVVGGHEPERRDRKRTAFERPRRVHVRCCESASASIRPTAASACASVREQVGGKHAPDVTMVQPDAVTSALPAPICVGLSRRRLNGREARGAGAYAVQEVEGPGEDEGPALEDELFEADDLCLQTAGRDVSHLCGALWGRTWSLCSSRMPQCSLSVS